MQNFPEILLLQPITNETFKRVLDVKLGGEPMLPQTVLGTKPLLQNIIKNLNTVLLV
jgi:hypothetical protein